MTEQSGLGARAGEEEQGTRVAWAPQPGKQEAAIACPVTEIFYGGARGGGKSDYLIGDFAMHGQKWGDGAKGIIFRREATDMTQLEARAIEILSALGYRHRSSPRIEFFGPQGQYLRLSHLKTAADAAGYKGQEYTWIGVDEADEFPDPTPIDLLRGTLRSTKGVPSYLRLTGNPGGAGHGWLKSRYIDPYPAGMKPVAFKPQPELRPDIIVEAIFIPARLEDNPLLMAQDPEYEDRLAQTGGPQLYKAWRLGDWDAIVGAVFAEWRQHLHIMPPNWRVPPEWRLAAGMDWGYRAPGCFLLFAIGPDGDTVAIDELYFKEQTGLEAGYAVGLICKRWGRVEYIAGDTQMWQKTGVSSPTIAEEVQNGILRAFKPGTHMAPTLIGEKKQGGYRAAKVVTTHSYLGWKETEHPETHKPWVAPWNQPRLKFMPQCKHVIRTLPALPYDKNRPEDVDTDAEDHPYDAMTAFLMSRPPPADRTRPDVPIGVHPGTDLRTKRRKPRYLKALEERQRGGASADLTGLVPYTGGLV